MEIAGKTTNEYMHIVKYPLFVSIALSAIRPFLIYPLIGVFLFFVDLIIYGWAGYLTMALYEGELTNSMVSGSFIGIVWGMVLAMVSLVISSSKILGTEDIFIKTAIIALGFGIPILLGLMLGAVSALVGGLVARTIRG